MTRVQIVALLTKSQTMGLKSWLISHSLWRFERNLRTDGDQDQRLEQIELLPKNASSAF